MISHALRQGLVAQAIGKSFRNRPILMGIDIVVGRGEVVGLLGPNGAGKTTCFSIMTGLLRPDTGKIFLEGRDITVMPLYKRARFGIGYLPQEASIFRGLSVEKNIRAVLELSEKDPNIREQRLDFLLDEFSISHIRQLPAISLSGGERRRVEIARALAMNPDFLLLDEPLAGIDPIAVGEIREFILYLREMGLGILLTDHNVRETLTIVDRAYILAQGKILAEGTPLDISSHEGVRRVYLGERFML